MKEKLKKEVLKSFDGSFSGPRKLILEKKVRIFNKKNKTNFWLELEQHGSADLYSWIAIRTGGKNGSLVYIKNLTGSMRVKFLEKIEELKALMKNQERISLEHKKVIQGTLF